LGGKYLLKRVLVRINTEITTINKSKMELLLELFILIVPRIATKGRQKKSATKGDAVRDVLLILGNPLFDTQCAAYNTNTRAFKVIIKGRVDRGSKIPVRGYNSFIDNPINIKNAILNPIENKRFSVVLKPCSLKIPSIIIPGTNVR